MERGSGDTPDVPLSVPGQEASADPRALLTGATLGGVYELHDVVGVGGMGTVYRALDLRRVREVAVKVLDPRFDPAKDPAFRERFQREARLSMRLAHSNIVEVFDTGDHEGVSYIVMELLKGETLFALLERERALPPARALELFREMCAGLAFAHDMGLVHRDLKPANVMVVRDASGLQVVKLLDFGLAKPFTASPSNDEEVTRNNVVMGSPTYMAPEQARGEAGVAGDIYSIGVVLYRMLTGRAPFSGRNAIDVIVQHLQAPPPLFVEVAPQVRVSEALEAVVLKCLEKNPADRFPSVNALLAAIDDAEASPTSPLPLQRTRTRTTQLTQALTPPPTGPVELFSNERPQPSAYGWLWGLLAIVAVAGGAWLLGRSSVEAPVVVPPAPVAVATAPTPVPAPVVAPPPEPAAAAVSVAKGPVTFRINSIPAGATVRLAGQVMGQTPVSFEVPAEENGEATAELTLELRGYQSLTFIATSSGPRFDLMQRLQRGTGRVQLAPVRPELAPTPVVAPPPVAPVVAAPVPVAPVSAPVARPAVAAPVAAAGGSAPVLRPAVEVPVAPAPAAAPSPAGDLVPLEQLTVRPRLVNPGEAPRYTREAMAARVEDTFVARCRVTRAGRLTNCRVTKSVPMMDEVVLQSLGTRQYEPGLVGTTPVETELSVMMRLSAH
jgi:serine/threonine-protein kinase